MPSGKKTDSGTLKRVREMCLKGLGNAAIARETGMKSSTISAYRKEWGVPARKRGGTSRAARPRPVPRAPSP